MPDDRLPVLLYGTLREGQERRRLI